MCLNPKLKEQAERLYDGCVNGLPFEVGRYNRETEAAFDEARQMVSDPNIKTFANSDEMFADIRSKIK